VPHLDWPGVAQVGRIEREREIRGQTSREVAYAVTSLTREQAGPEALLSLVRGHWAIESAPQAQERKVRDELTDRAQAA
jgi:hypothetical protein